MRNLYSEIGEDKLRLLVDKFYDIVEQDPAVEELHLLHLRGHGINHSRSEQFRFLSGFFGGPKLYVEKFGHANLTRIHEHIEIGPTLRTLWLNCMARAVSEIKLPEETGAEVMRHLTRIVSTIGRSRQ
ncbi:hypothetical protein A3862_04320 [Methylobacterium sp. XJLW]|uniref:globin domain-containing protein n=1 Tax=Methylobacterium sp. XJLW TaxID=739141 RepID=UPI000DAB00EA|nr:globin [Methylobacterium sp. XJLW]AWV14824.1 hypothetical protein A3862_04320 [Methylobacterium sp. XJLW]